MSLARFELPWLCPWLLVVVAGAALVLVVVVVEVSPLESELGANDHI